MTSRRRLPNRRDAETIEVMHGKKNTRFKITIGFYHDKAPAEVFVSGAKVGSEMEAMVRDAAVILSIAMQYGVPLDVISGAITREHDGSSSSIIGAVVDRLCEPVPVEAVP